MYVFPLDVISIHDLNLRNLKGNGNAAIDAVKLAKSVKIAVWLYLE